MSNAKPLCEPNLFVKVKKKAMVAKRLRDKLNAVLKTLIASTRVRMCLHTAYMFLTPLKIFLVESSWKT